MKNLATALSFSLLGAATAASISAVYAQQERRSDVELVQSLIDEFESLQGAVVAFDRPEGCPDGWSEYTDAYGRVVVGAIPNGRVPPAQMSHQVEDFRDYFLGIKRSEERVALTVEQMPPHTHGLDMFNAPNHDGTGGAHPQGGDYQREFLFVNSGSTRQTGQGLSHNNMPPYIALKFCKKD